LPRDTIISSSGPRLPFDNGKVDGSIKLTGGTIDDLHLQSYRETLDPKSDEIVFLTPQGSAGATFAEIGWTGAPGSATLVPGPSTLWSAAGTKLTATSPVTLTWDNGQGLKFTRTVALDDNYMFTITDRVENASPAPVTLYPYAVVTRDGEPTHQSNWLVHEGLTGVLQGIWQKDTTYADARKFEGGQVKLESTGGWVGVTDKYWHATLIPPQKEKFTGRFSYAKQGEHELFRADYLLGARNVAAGSSATVTHHFYAGAKVVSLIEKYQRDLGIDRYDMTVDWGWFSFFTYWMFRAIDWLYLQVGNFGVAIILFTIAIKVLIFPLANRSYESANKMKKIQPEMKAIQERYKDDAMKARQEQAALFQREGVNPLMGCVPVLLTMPILFSLYKVLTITIEMRHAPFFGWIQDLSAADPTSFVNLFGLLPFAVPVWLHIGVWPLLMGVTMWVQMKMSPPAGGDPTQQQVMQFMPVMFTYMMGQVAAGLVIYWTISNFLGIIQQYVLMRRMKVPIEIIDNFKWPAWLGGKSGAG
jgi:YidC/Oxa1 family membrane protein insertase